jgi:hypothetical protein
MSPNFYLPVASIRANPDRRIVLAQDGNYYPQRQTADQWEHFNSESGFISFSTIAEALHWLAPAQERYIVVKAYPYGYSIIDTTGQEKPYTICHFVSTEEAKQDPDYLLDPMFDVHFKLVDDKFVYELDPRYMTPAEIERSEASDKEVAEHWCEKWNLVEAGHCGACRKKFAEGEKRYPAVGFHELDRTICFHCACSQED